MKKLLLVLGGLRIGDTFHMIPYIHTHQDYEITWITGTYEEPAAKFIQSQYPNIKSIITHPDGLPMYKEDRIHFHDRLNLTQNYIDQFDKYEKNINISIDLSPEIYSKTSDYLFNFKRLYTISTEPYVVIHANSISNWKNLVSISKYIPNIKAYTIGTNCAPLPGTIDKTNLPIIESAKLILNSTQFIGIHSAMACLNLYLNHSGIVLHFSNDLLKFHDFNEKMQDILPKEWL